VNPSQPRFFASLPPSRILIMCNRLLNANRNFVSRVSRMSWGSRVEEFTGDVLQALLADGRSRAERLSRPSLTELVSSGHLEMTSLTGLSIKVLSEAFPD
jgi:hypothetical protein